jgi:hypothetical protein
MHILHKSAVVELWYLSDVDQFVPDHIVVLERTQAGDVGIHPENICLSYPSASH